MATKRIVFFTHKGGVGKTTITFHVACVLGSLGKKVLLVDADPQCNLSSYVIKEESLDEMLDASDGPTGETVWSAIRHVVSGTGNVKPVDPLQLNISGVCILPGDIRLFDYESALNDFWAECARRRERGFIGVSALSTAVASACSEGSFDYVLYDVGPNIGALNRSIVLDCDAIVVPAACDLFSARSFKTLGAAIHTWLTEWHALSTLAPASFPRLSGSPALLGYTVQRFKLYGGVPTEAAGKYMANLNSRVSSDLVAVFKEAPGSRVHKDAGSRPIGEIKEFSRLVPISQREGLPVFELSDATPEERTLALHQFSELVKRMRSRLGGTNA
jgi:cellulose biosynthesis protein BcsQ